MFDGKSILVTGGTGSFGKAFIGRVLERWKPRRVIVYSRDELKQYEMQQDLRSEAMRYFIKESFTKGPESSEICANVWKRPSPATAYASGGQ